eukprot:8316936-Alexandrium_andersonii.AAC.1
MSASLVGSEMCIRDRLCGAHLVSPLYTWYCATCVPRVRACCSCSPDCGATHRAPILRRAS